ncbi:MAG: hypothetical protein AAGD92_11750 [Pseudomonadota bacterium]
MADFFDDLPDDQKTLAKKLRAFVRRHDKNVEESEGDYMKMPAVRFCEAGVDKYAIAKTKRGLTFHTMVMYAFPDIGVLAKKTLSGVKLQKGCINIIRPATLSLDAFEDFIAAGAKKDYTGVVEYYREKKKEKRR